MYNNYHITSIRNRLQQTIQSSETNPYDNNNQNSNPNFPPKTRHSQTKLQLQSPQITANFTSTNALNKTQQQVPLVETELQAT